MTDNDRPRRREAAVGHQFVVSDYFVVRLAGWTPKVDEAIRSAAWHC